MTFGRIEGTAGILLGGHIDDIAGLGDGTDQLGAGGVGLQLVPQPADPGPEELDIVTLLRPPYLGEQLLVGHQAAAVSGEFTQQQPLNPRKVYLLPVTGNGVPVKINDHITQ